MNKPAETIIHISLQSVLMIFGLVLAGYLLYLVRTIVVLMFLAFIVMTALNPLVQKMVSKLKFPRILAIITAYLWLILIIVLLIALVLPPLAGELYGLVKVLDLPFLQSEISLIEFLIGQLSEFTSKFDGNSGTISSVISATSVIAAAISATFSGIFAFFTMMVMSIYMTIDRANLHKKIIWFTKSELHLHEAKKFLDLVEEQLGGWIRGQLILMLAIAVITYIGLSLLGVPYALPLAVLAGVLEILPNIGPTVAALPSILLALLTISPAMAGVVTVFYILLQQLENNLIVPRVMKQNADVNPLVAMVVILSGLELSGVIGALLAVPIYIVARSFYGLWYRQNIK